VEFDLCDSDLCFQTTSLNDAKFNFVQFLQEIASEQQFEVTYVGVEEKSSAGILAGTKVEYG
jgi:hypothetical protein